METPTKAENIKYGYELNMIYHKSKNYWSRIISIFLIIISFNTCNKENLYPTLKVENQLEDYWRSIIEVSLIGYEFDNLNIEPNGDSQSFILDKGMPGGFEEINVTIRYIRFSGVITTASIKVDFKGGETTKIILTGCDVGGCSGIYLESNP
ncbi:MAG: hypothetical protein U0W24_26485 [Bacteroidales bacterium]